MKLKPESVKKKRKEVQKKIEAATIKKRNLKQDQ